MTKIRIECIRPWSHRLCKCSIRTTEYFVSFKFRIPHSPFNLNMARKHIQRNISFVCKREIMWNNWIVECRALVYSFFFGFVARIANEIENMCTLHAICALHTFFPLIFFNRFHSSSSSLYFSDMHAYIVHCHPLCQV